MDYGGLALIIGAVLGAGGVGALLKSRSENRKLNAQSAKLDVEAEVTLGSGWQLLVAEQRKELNELRERTVVLEHRASISEEREAKCLDKLAKIEAGAVGLSAAHVEKLVGSALESELARREGL